MDINEVISGRRSAREYTARWLEEQMMRRLIDAAEHEPNGVKRPPWTFTVAGDQALLDRLWRDEQAHMLATIPASP